MSLHYPISQIRNIGIIAHIDAGKTTLTERVLYYSGRTHRVGSVDDGTTVTDWMAQERERGITITAAAITTTWQDTVTGQRAQINLIDTPGHIDFTAEVQRSLRVLDGGIVVFDGVAGVEAQSETVWRQADRFGVPRICFINKMDRPGANVERTLAMMRDRLGATPVLVQLPVFENSEFVGAVDLFTMQALIFSGEAGAPPDVRPIPDDLRSAADEAHQTMVEHIVEHNDALMERFLDGETIPNAELYVTLRSATLANALVPVFVGSALHNRGVQPVLDAVVRYLPSPLDIPPATGSEPESGAQVERPADPDAPFCGLVFKVVTDAFMGRMNYVRVYSGTLDASSRIDNASRDCEERVARVLQMYANKREDVGTCSAGDIVGIIGFKQSFTGDTLCDIDAPIVMEAIEFPQPVIRVAIKPLAQTRGRPADGGAAQAVGRRSDVYHRLRRRRRSRRSFTGWGSCTWIFSWTVCDANSTCSATSRRHRPRTRRRSRGDPGLRGAISTKAVDRGAMAWCDWISSATSRARVSRLRIAPTRSICRSITSSAAEKGIRDAMQEGELAAFPVTDVACHDHRRAFSRDRFAPAGLRDRGQHRVQECVSSVLNQSC